MISRDAIAASLSDYETLIGELPLIRRQFSVADNVNYCFVGIRRSGKSYLMLSLQFPGIFDGCGRSVQRRLSREYAGAGCGCGSL